MTPCEIFSRAPLGTTNDLASRKLITAPLVMLTLPPGFTTIRALLSVAPSIFQTPSLQTTILRCGAKVAVLSWRSFISMALSLLRKNRYKS